MFIDFPALIVWLLILSGPGEIGAAATPATGLTRLWRDTNVATYLEKYMIM